MEENIFKTNKRRMIFEVFKRLPRSMRTRDNWSKYQDQLHLLPGLPSVILRMLTYYRDFEQQPLVRDLSIRVTRKEWFLDLYLGDIRIKPRDNRIDHILRDCIITINTKGTIKFRRITFTPGEIYNHFLHPHFDEIDYSGNSCNHGSSFTTACKRDFYTIINNARKAIKNLRYNQITLKVHLSNLYSFLEHFNPDSPVNNAYRVRLQHLGIEDKKLQPSDCQKIINRNLISFDFRLTHQNCKLIIPIIPDDKTALMEILEQSVYDYNSYHFEGKFYKSAIKPKPGYEGQLAEVVDESLTYYGFNEPFKINIYNDEEEQQTERKIDPQIFERSVQRLFTAYQQSSKYQPLRTKADNRLQTGHTTVSRKRVMEPAV